MTKETLSGSDYEALANLRHTLRRFMDFSTSAAQEEGLPSQQQDKRRQTLTLTAKADAVLLRLSAVHLKEIREMAPELIGILQRLQAKIS
jgi:hypothetical protein